jgi:hypothetical protein
MSTATQSSIGLERHAASTTTVSSGAALVSQRSATRQGRSSANRTAIFFASSGRNGLHLTSLVGHQQRARRVCATPPEGPRPARRPVPLPAIRERSVPTARQNTAAPLRSLAARLPVEARAKAPRAAVGLAPRPSHGGGLRTHSSCSSVALSCSTRHPSRRHGGAGVWTRRVDQLVESLGLRVSRSEVSRICAGLDEQVEAFRTRPLEGRYLYLFFDAKVEKVRDGGRVQASAWSSPTACTRPAAERSSAWMSAPFESGLAIELATGPVAVHRGPVRPPAFPGQASVSTRRRAHARSGREAEVIGIRCRGRARMRCERLSRANSPRPDPSVMPLAGSTAALHGRGQRVLRRRSVEARYRWARLGQQRGTSAERGSGWPNRGPRETRPRNAPRVVGVIMPAGGAPDSVTASHRPLPARRR